MSGLPSRPAGRASGVPQPPMLPQRRFRVEPVQSDSFQQEWQGPVFASHGLARRLSQPKFFGEEKFVQVEKQYFGIKSLCQAEEVIAWAFPFWKLAKDEFPLLQP